MNARVQAAISDRLRQADLAAASGPVPEGHTTRSAKKKAGWSAVLLRGWTELVAHLVAAGPYLVAVNRYGPGYALPILPTAAAPPIAADPASAPPVAVIEPADPVPVRDTPGPPAAASGA